MLVDGPCSGSFFVPTVSMPKHSLNAPCTLTLRVLWHLQIEPLQQTEMLDETMAIEGVLFSGVPGAGGYDAIFAVVLGEATVERVGGYWSQYNVVPLGSDVSDLVVDHQSQGVLSVDVTTLAPWLVSSSVSSGLHSS